MGVWSAQRSVSTGLIHGGFQQPGVTAGRIADSKDSGIGVGA